MVGRVGEGGAGGGGGEAGDVDVVLDGDGGAPERAAAGAFGFEGGGAGEEVSVGDAVDPERRVGVGGVGGEGGADLGGGGHTSQG